MKKIKTLLLFVLVGATTTNAQLTATAIPMPTGYSYSDVALNGVPLYMDNNILYGYTEKMVGSTLQGYIFKYDANTEAINILNGAIFSANYATNFNKVNGRICFTSASQLYIIDPATNTVNIALNSCPYYQIIGNKIYSIQSGNTTTQTTYIFDTATNTTTEYTIPVMVNTTLTQQYLALRYCANLGTTKMYAFGRFQNFDSITGNYFYDYRIFLIDSSGIQTALDLPDNYYISDIGGSTNPEPSKLDMLGDNILFFTGSNQLDVYNTTTNAINHNIYTGLCANSFIYNNILYFDDGSLMHKTDGVTSQAAGFSIFYYNTMSLHNDAVLYTFPYNNKLYGSKMDGFWVSDCTLQNTLNLSPSYSDLRNPIVANNKMYFIGNNNALVEYNDATNTFNEYLNGMTSTERPIFSYQNTLYTNLQYNAGGGNSLYKIDLNVLSNSQFNKNTFTISPNPTSTLINVQSQDPITKATIFDLNGRKILEKQSDAIEKIDVSSLEKGVYILQMQNGDKTETQKLIKE